MRLRHLPAAGRLAEEKEDELLAHSETSGDDVLEPIAGVLVILLALLWVIGTPGRMFLAILAMMAFVMIVLVIVALLWVRLGHMIEQNDRIIALLEQRR